MTEILHRKRARTLRNLAAACGALAALLLLLSVCSGGSGPSARQGEPVFPRLKERFADMVRVEVSLPDDGYTLVKTDAGWGLAEFGNFPITTEALSSLFDGLSELSYAAPRTADPEKYSRIGVGDPEAGGLGARVRLFGPDETLILDAIIGRRGTRNYIRAADEARAWLVDGDLPPFYARAEWVDLDFVRVAAEEIMEVRISGAPGSYGLARDGENFVPTGANERLVSRFAAIGPALAMSRWAPVAVKRMGDVAGLEPFAEHTTHLRDGRTIRLELWRETGGAIWVTAADSGASASGTGDMTEGWLFRLPPQDIADLTMPRDAVIRTVE